VLLVVVVVLVLELVVDLLDRKVLRAYPDLVPKACQDLQDQRVHKVPKAIQVLLDHKALLTNCLTDM
jgi:hypothetical protein